MGCRTLDLAAGARRPSYNPLDETPVLFAPTDLLRHLPWINYEDYYKSVYTRLILRRDRRRRVPKEAVLAYNKRHYTDVEAYVEYKERDAGACEAAPLFRPLRSRPCEGN